MGNIYLHGPSNSTVNSGKLCDKLLIVRSRREVVLGLALMCSDEEYEAMCLNIGAVAINILL